MIKHIVALLVLTGLSLAAHAAPSLGDAAHGKKLHNANCVACHDDGVYKRKDRRIKSIEGLKGQISGCGHQLKKSLTQDQINDLVKYLNDTYYKFK